MHKRGGFLVLWVGCSCSLHGDWVDRELCSVVWWLPVLWDVCQAFCRWRTLLLPHKPSPAFMSNVSYLKKEDNKSGLKLLQDFGVLLHAGVVETRSQDQHSTKGEPQEYRQSRWWPVMHHYVVTAGNNMFNDFFWLTKSNPSLCFPFFPHSLVHRWSFPQYWRRTATVNCLLFPVHWGVGGLFLML